MLVSRYHKITVIVQRVLSVLYVQCLPPAAGVSLTGTRSSSYVTELETPLEHCRELCGVSMYVRVCGHVSGCVCVCVCVGM